MIATADQRGSPLSVVGKKRDYISHSAITTYQQCPLRYRFKYVDGLPETVVSSALIFGGAIHSTLEYSTIPCDCTVHWATDHRQQSLFSRPVKAIKSPLNEWYHLQGQIKVTTVAAFLTSVYNTWCHCRMHSGFGNFD